MMGRLIATANCPANLSPWWGLDLKSVSAGANGFLAVTEDGRAFFMEIRPVKSGFSLFGAPRRQEYESRLHGMGNDWRDLASASLSKAVPGAAVGLRRNGTCVCRCPGNNRVEQEVAQWENVVQVRISDGVFGLRADGTVVHVSFDRGTDAYAQADAWRNVTRIAVGSQNALFAVTEEGRVLFTGNPHMPWDQNRLTELRDVADLCATGSENGEVAYLTRDGRVCCMNRRAPELRIEPPREGEVFASHFWYSVLVRDASGGLTPLLNEAGSLGETAQWRGVKSFDLGDVNYGEPYALAIV